MRTVRQACLVLGFLGIPGSALALEFPATVIAGANSIDGPINFGVGPEQLHALFRHKAKDLEALIAAHNDTIALLKEKLEINEQQIRAALLAAGEKEVPPERLAATLAEIGERYRILRASMTRDTDDGPEVARLKDRADKAIDAGELALADNLLARIQDLQRRSAVARAHIRARRGDVALAGLHYREAAGHFGAAAADVLPGHGDLRLAYLEQEANALFRQGEAFGDSLALNTAIERFRSLLVLRPHDRMPLDWAMTQNSLGLALTTLGTRESGTARLEQAITAFREALKERTRERAPLDWAETQNDLALALKTLGARESGAARLEQAVAAYREALKEWTRERAPLDWAMTQNNLGAALWMLAERESGTARLEQAVAAYREALQEYTRESGPLDWAATQNNLGLALWRLGERVSGTARLEEAVTAFRQALTEWTRERVPLQWAAVQNNLGAALLRLGEREGGVARLEQAVAAFRQALKERTRERVPLDWAMTQNDLGTALRALGGRENGTARLEQAVATYREALKEYTRERVPLDWAMATGNQGVALMVLAERRGDAATAQTAVRQIDLAFQTMHEAHYTPFAAYYESRLPEARALFDRLSRR